MPKRAVDSLTGIRFEMNETERDALRFYTASASIRNVGQGVGAVAKPVLDNLAVITAALIAYNGLDGIRDLADNWQQNYYSNRNQYEVDAYEKYLATTNDDPIMSEQEYTESVTQKTYDYRAADWWQRNVGNRLRRFLNPGVDQSES